jgi:hypothetical protein
MIRSLCKDLGIKTTTLWQDNTIYLLAYGSTPIESVEPAHPHYYLIWTDESVTFKYRNCNLHCTILLTVTLNDPDSITKLNAAIDKAIPAHQRKPVSHKVLIKASCSRKHCALTTHGVIKASTWSKFKLWIFNRLFPEHKICWLAAIERHYNLPPATMQSISDMAESLLRKNEDVRKIKLDNRIVKSQKK